MQNKYIFFNLHHCNGTSTYYYKKIISKKYFFQSLSKNFVENMDVFENIDVTKVFFFVGFFLD